MQHVREDPRRADRLVGSDERFDRIGFAMELLRVLRPPLTIAVYERRHDLRVDQSRLLGPSSAWAMLGIPPHASRERIALAVAELAGVARVPFAVDLLVRAGRTSET